MPACVHAALDTVAFVTTSSAPAHPSAPAAALTSFIVSSSRSEFHERQRRLSQLLAASSSAPTEIAFLTREPLDANLTHCHFMAGLARMRTHHGLYNYLTHLAVARSIVRRALPVALVMEDDASPLYRPGVPNLLTDLAALVQRDDSFAIMFAGSALRQKAQAIGPCSHLAPLSHAICLGRQLQWPTC